MTKEHGPTHAFEHESPSLETQAQHLTVFRDQLLQTLQHGGTVMQFIADQCDGTPLPRTYKFHITDQGISYSTLYRREIDRRERVQRGRLARFVSENVLVTADHIDRPEVEQLLIYFDTLRKERELSLPNLSDDYSEIVPHADS